MIDDPWRHKCNNWFKDDMGELIGLDVFARPFPTETGWDIYENDIARVLIIRQENLDRLPDALGKLYGIEPSTVKMENRNRGDEKDYSSQYNTVKKAWRPSESDLEEVYSAAYVHHFYTAQEIEGFKHRWRTAATVHRQTSPIAEKSVRTNSQVQTLAATSKPATHDRSCRPCPQCEQELQSIPELQKACRERLEIIERLQSFWPVKIMRKCSNIYKRLFHGARAAK
jgi:hypothetical protein